MCGNLLKQRNYGLVEQKYLFAKLIGMIYFKIKPYYVLFLWLIFYSLVANTSLSSEQSQSSEPKLTFFRPPYFGEITITNQMTYFHGLNLIYNTDVFTQALYREETFAPFAHVIIDKRSYIFCTTYWAGNRYDLWVIEQDKTNKNTGRIYFTGKTLFDYSSLIDKWIKYAIFEFIPIIKFRSIQNNGRLIRFRLRYYYLFQDSILSNDFILNLDEIRTDSDGDQLTDLFEDRIGTDKNEQDTDKDGILDVFDTNPLFSNIDNECEPYRIIFNEFYGKHNFFLIYVVEYEGKEQCQLNTDNSLILDKPKSEFNLYWYLKFGKKIINDDRTVDINFYNYCGQICSSESIYKFKIEDNKWKIIEVKLLRVS